MQKYRLEYQTPQLYIVKKIKVALNNDINIRI
jgi:hypothetical protein